MSTTSLVQELRSRVKDTRTTVRAFGVSVTDPAATVATLEISGGYFRVTVVGGTTSSLNLPLADGSYESMGKLVRAISSMAGYVVSPDTDMDQSFETLSIVDLGPVSCLRRQADVAHKLFSDVWLSDIVRRAVLKHNPSIPNPDALPVGEEELVLTLAQAMLMRHLATDSVRRRGLSMTTDELLKVAQALDDDYSVTYKRLARAIQSPREASSNIMREGDIVVAKISRRLRNGRVKSIGSIPPETPVIIEPDDSDVEDTRVYLSWERSADDNFYYYEMWRGPDAGVERNREGYTRMQYTPLGSPGSRDALATTGGWFCGLEPDSEYYFRLYVVDRNGEYSGSTVTQVYTRSLRSKMSTTTPPTPALVSAGDSIVVTFDPAYTAPDADMVITLGDKPAVYTLTGAYEISVVVPTFFQKGVKTLKVVSSNGLSSSYASIQVM